MTAVASNKFARLLCVSKTLQGIPTCKQTSFYGSSCADNGKGARNTPEGIPVDADGQAALQLGEHVGGLAGVEGAGADKEDVVRVHVA
eukprot:2473564-Pyramimonas_sp.AAC.3